MNVKNGDVAISKAEAVRRVVADHPDIKPKEGVALMRSNFDIVIGTAHFSAIKSQLRTRMRREKGREEAEPTLSGLRAARRTIRELADSEELRRASHDPNDLIAWAVVVGRVEMAAKKVGGMAKLKESLEFMGEGM